MLVDGRAARVEDARFHKFHGSSPGTKCAPRILNNLSSSQSLNTILLSASAIFGDEKEVDGTTEGGQQIV